MEDTETLKGSKSWMSKSDVVLLLRSSGRCCSTVTSGEVPPLPFPLLPPLLFLLASRRCCPDCTRTCVDWAGCGKPATEKLVCCNADDPPKNSNDPLPKLPAAVSSVCTVLHNFGDAFAASELVFSSFSAAKYSWLAPLNQFGALRMAR